jgi:hypothetical protein
MACFAERNFRLCHAPACLVVSPNGGKSGKDYPLRDENHSAQNDDSNRLN